MNRVFSSIISGWNKLSLVHMCLARFNRHRIKPDLHFSGQNALKLSKRFACVGFFQTTYPILSQLILFQHQEKAIVLESCSTVNFILGHSAD